jgi:hypothetical protein
MAARLIDLEAPQESTTAVVVRYRGVLTSVTRERLLALLKLEEQQLETALGAETVEPAAATPPLVPDAGPFTHASLSTRIKKVYDYSVRTRNVRPTHAGLLAEVLSGFDWQIPPHPNTHLVQHLGEIKTWNGVEAPLKAAIDAFLARYLARRDSGR